MRITDIRETSIALNSTLQNSSIDFSEMTTSVVALVTDVQRAAGVAAGGIESETDHRAAVAHDIGDHRHDRRGHLGEIEARIPDLGLQRDRAFADVDDTHVAYSNFCYSALRKRDGSVRRTHMQEPMGASHVSISAVRAPGGRRNPRDHRRK